MADGTPRGWIKVDDYHSGDVTTTGTFANVTGFTGATIYFATAITVRNKSANSQLIRHATTGEHHEIPAGPGTWEWPIACGTGLRIDTTTPLQVKQDSGAGDVRVTVSGIVLAA